MPGVVVLESMWNKKGRLLDDEPSVLPYLKAIRQSLAWEGIRVNLVYRRFYSSYDLGLLLEEVRRRRRSFPGCWRGAPGPPLRRARTSPNWASARPHSISPRATSPA